MRGLVTRVRHIRGVVLVGLGGGVALGEEQRAGAGGLGVRVLVAELDDGHHGLGLAGTQHELVVPVLVPRTLGVVGDALVDKRLVGGELRRLVQRGDSPVLATAGRRLRRGTDALSIGENTEACGGEVQLCHCRGMWLLVLEIQQLLMDDSMQC